MATCQNPLSARLTWEGGAPGDGAPRHDWWANITNFHVFPWKFHTFLEISCQILRVSYIHLVGCPWQWVQIPQKSNEISEIIRKSMEFISDSRKLHRKSWEIPANIIGFHKKLLGCPWEWIRVISAGGAPQAPWRHTEGCARGAPTSFRIGLEFVGSLTKIKTLVLW